MGTTFVYLVTGPSGKRYVGITAKSVASRWNRHVWASAGKPKGALQSAISKYGKEAFSVEQIYLCENWVDACEQERYFITTLKTMAPNGYNLSPGGEGDAPGAVRGAGTRAKIAAAWLAMSDEDRALRCKKISDANAKRSPEDSARISELISASKRGKARPVEVVAKVSASRTGQKKTLDQIEKTASKNRGRKHSAESRANMASAAQARRDLTSANSLEYWRQHPGTKMSEEACAKMSAAARARSAQTAENMREIWRLRRLSSAA